MSVVNVPNRVNVIISRGGWQGPPGSSGVAGPAGTGTGIGGNAGVTSLNNKSGVLFATGLGNITVTTTGQIISISGNTGAYSSFYSVNNPSGFISSLSGLSTGLINNLSGAFDSKISTYSGFATGSYYTKNNESGFLTNLSGLSTSLITNLSGELDLKIFNTGSALNSRISSLSGYVTGGFSAVKVTGSNILAIANFSGISGIVVTSSGSFVYVSGDSAILANKADVQSTGISLTSLIQQSGQAVDTKTNLLSGYSNSTFATISNVFSTGQNLQNQVNTIRQAYVTGISISGGAYVTGGINFSGIGGLVVIQSGYNTFLFSGGAASSSSSSGPFTGISGISVSGSSPTITGLFNISGAGGVALILAGNTLTISGTSAGGGEINTASSVGLGSGLFSQKVGVDLQFKSIKAGSSDLYITGSSTELAITFTGLYMAPSSGVAIDAKINSLSGFSTATFSTITNLFTTGSTLDNRINSLSGFLTGGYSSLKITGSNTIIAPNFTGVSGIVITVSGSNNIFFSGDSNILANVGNLFSTGSSLFSLINSSGSTLNNRINSLSGFITGKNYITGISISGGLGMTGAINISAGSNITLNWIDPNSFSIASSAGGGIGGVTGISISGSNSITGRVVFTGVGSNTVILSGNTVIISGAPLGSFVDFSIGETLIVSGTNFTTTTFNNPFQVRPFVVASIINISGEAVPSFCVSGVTPTGFSTYYSNYLLSNNYRLNFVATTGSGSFTIGGSPSNSSALYGSGTPESVQTANVGVSYWDTFNKSFWVKDVSSTNTGWFQLIA